jgi:predicted metal-dependent phosphoesterase TrpH
VLEAARERGLEAVAGIEITAVEDARDIHVLGYFVDQDTRGVLPGFLASQRALRVERIEAIIERLGALGMPLDRRVVLGNGSGYPGRSVGRPLVARAMVAAGYAADIREAFDKWLGPTCPAFVPRSGPPVSAVIGIVHDAGGLVSLAHPGRTRIDGRIPALRDAGLDGLEVYHSDHDPAQTTVYARLAASLGLLATGGSDFHGEPSRGIEPGAASLPWADWERLTAARARHV